MVSNNVQQGVPRMPTSSNIRGDLELRRTMELRRGRPAGWPSARVAPCTVSSTRAPTTPAGPWMDIRW
jgi:hypothetical protein